ncbi:MAG TPA: kinase, partial [Candidatus Tectomicrobia bacterium]
MISMHPQFPLSGVGHGTAMAHHGEIMQGVYVRPDGRRCRVLVTLPYPQRGAQATFLPMADSPVTVEPAWKSKACRAALLTLTYCGWSGWGGRLVVHSTTPPRWGFGSSTSDVTATIRAVSNVCRVQLPAAVIATLAVQAETASDAIMFENRAVLFAHRSGVVIEDFGAPMPGLEVVGVNTDPTETGVDTLDTPPAWYSNQELQTFQELVACLRQAIATHDPRLI